MSCRLRDTRPRPSTARARLDDLVHSIATDRVKVQRLGYPGKDVADIPL